MKRIKQVILIRRDLKMRRGKEIAQGSHASIAFLLAHLAEAARGGAPVFTEDEAQWMEHGQAKVCLQVNSEAELLEFHEKARAAGLVSHVIQDSGRTEFHGEATFTACAIGPAETEKIDAVTGQLQLY